MRHRHHGELPMEAHLNPILLYGLHIALYAAFPLYFATLRHSLRLVLLYTYIGVVLLIGGFVGLVYSLPLGDGVVISAGTVAYGALMMSTVVLVILGRDPAVVRNVIRIVVTINAFKLCVFSIAAWALTTPDVRNPFAVSPAVFNVSVQSVLVGGGLIIFELLVLLVLFEQAKRITRHTHLVSVIYVAAFVAVLCLDGALFPLLASTFSPTLPSLVTGAVKGKLVLGLSFGVPLVAFLVVFRPLIEQYRSTTTRLHELLLTPREELVHELERREDELASVEANYRNLVESTGDAIIGSSVEGLVTSWNHAAEVLLGYSGAEIIGRPARQLVPADRVPDMAKVLASVQRGDAAVDLELEMWRRDGSAVEVALTVSPVMDSSSMVVGISVIARDIGERRRLQRSLEQQALHDSLTGLPNRVLFADRLAHALRSARTPPLPRRRAVRGPGPVQDGQRRCGPPDRGPGPDRGRPTARRRVPGRGHGRPFRRGRVRRALRGH